MIWLGKHFCPFFELKEYFVSDFNAFIDYASMDKSSLDYLEIVIPVQALDYLRIGPDFSNGLPVTIVKG